MRAIHQAVRGAPLVDREDAARPEKHLTALCIQNPRIHRYLSGGWLAVQATLAGEKQGAPPADFVEVENELEACLADAAIAVANHVLLVCHDGAERTVEGDIREGHAWRSRGELGARGIEDRR
jgi:hypothetical protein